MGPIELAAAIVHEVRRLLTPARAHAELAMMKPGLSEDAAQSMIEIVRAATACDSLMEVMVELGKHRGVCNLNTVLRDLSLRFGFVLESDAEVEVALPAAAVESVIANLASNAQRAGAVEIQVRVHRSTGNSSFVGVEVEDTGRGMDAAARSLALMPFSSGNASVGIGLNLCRAIVESAGGRFDLQSTPGVGTRVSMTMPIAAATELRAAA